MIHLDEVYLRHGQHVAMDADMYEQRRPLVVYHDRPPLVIYRDVPAPIPPSLWSRIRTSIAESWSEAGRMQSACRAG